MRVSDRRSWPAGLGGVDAEKVQELGLQVAGFGDGCRLVPRGRDKAQFGEGLQDEPSGGSAGPTIVDVKTDHFGVGGEVAAYFAFDEAEDEQGQADHGDQRGDPAVAAQEDRRDGQGTLIRTTGSAMSQTRVR